MDLNLKLKAISGVKVDAVHVETDLEIAFVDVRCAGSAVEQDVGSFLQPTHRSAAAPRPGPFTNIFGV